MVPGWSARGDSLVSIAVTGGKGGTGKSTVAVNLAIALSKTIKGDSNSTVDLLDLDVECPNDYSLLGITTKLVSKVYKEIPVITNACNGCGICIQRCMPKALYALNGKANLIEDICEGCMLCQEVCPFNAINTGKKEVGEIRSGQYPGINLIEGRLAVGEDASARIVSDVLSVSRSKVRVMDTAAGTHCTVVRALRKADHALVVTEPTPFGANDARLMIDLVKELDIPYDIVLNRAGVSNYKLPFSPRFEIPYSDDLIQSYVVGKPILDFDPDSTVSKVFMEMAEYARGVLFGD